ncbi:murein hydrolase activator EnvC family protein [Metabacillus malikii]|uniref:Peptidoglycan hydrolase CwlO-like protein n=1 Tax=Metabacillus malikii TaxID=1504265 RepID=A0ABT9ZEI9_9BACI|nr:M23 family metallopeptidase [Metabacillus malikii]MDQ0230272.1 peptidoglycan hydrolase CwlO-like protein [Metabacillus malikii]
MRKKIFPHGMAVLIGIITIVTPIKNNAVTANSDLNQKKEELQNERNGISSTIEDKKDEIAELEQKKKNLDAEIELLDTKMTETNVQIRQLKLKIDADSKKIQELKEKIKVVEERIAKRNLLLKDRVRALQENGGVVNYLDVLLGSQDFGDFVSRINAVTTIVNADQEIIKDHEEDISLLEQSKLELNNELEELGKSVTGLETLKKTLNSQIEEKNKIMEQVTIDHEAAENELYKLEDESTFLKEQELTIQKELERQQSEAITSSNVSTVTDGSFMWPAKGTFTSGFGPRWGKLHGGVDIANSAEDVPIVASASGTVIRSYYSSSYGNAVFISHNINGKVYTTVYAHMDSRLVSSGQAVTKGQQIGYMGNTGRSTGKHLHFEIHKGAWKNPINPLNLLP